MNDWDMLNILFDVGIRIVLGVAFFVGVIFLIGMTYPRGK